MFIQFVTFVNIYHVLHGEANLHWGACRRGDERSGFWGHNIHVARAARTTACQGMQQECPIIRATDPTYVISIPRPHPNAPNAVDALAFPKPPRLTGLFLPILIIYCYRITENTCACDQKLKILLSNELIHYITYYFNVYIPILCIYSIKHISHHLHHQSNNYFDIDNFGIKNFKIL